MLNKESGESICVACSPISNDSAEPGKPTRGQSTGMESAMKCDNQTVAALKQRYPLMHLHDIHLIGTSLRSNLIGDQTNRANLGVTHKFPQPELDHPAAVVPGSQSKCKMNRLDANSGDKFGPSSADQQLANDAQLHMDSDSLQLLDEFNDSEADSDVQIVFQTDSNLNDRLIRNEKTDNPSSFGPLVELASSSSSASDTLDVPLDEDLYESYLNSRISPNPSTQGRHTLFILVFFLFSITRNSTAFECHVLLITMFSRGRRFRRIQRSRFPLNAQT